MIACFLFFYRFFVFTFDRRIERRDAAGASAKGHAHADGI